MGETKDLGLLISEAERMYNFFRAFEAIPRVLKSLQASQIDHETIKREVLRKEKELEGVELRVKDVKDILKELDGLKDVARNAINGLKTETEDRRRAILEEIHNEAKAVKAEIEAEIMKLRKKSEVAIAKNEKEVLVSETMMKDAISAHTKKIAEFAKKEKQAEKRAADAVTELNKIRKSLGIGG